MIPKQNQALFFDRRVDGLDACMKALLVSLSTIWKSILIKVVFNEPRYASGTHERIQVGNSSCLFHAISKRRFLVIIIIVYVTG